MRIGINGAVRSFGAVAAGIFLINAAVAIVSLGQLRVGGELYTQIANGKDLIGDILPPPEYVIEAYLETTLAMNDPASSKTAHSAIDKLHADFIDRRKYWANADLPASIKHDLDVAATAAEPFWTTVETDFFPALIAQDKARLQTAYAHIQAVYATHRAAIDHLVTDTNTFNSGLEQAAADNNRIYAPLLYVVSAIGFVVIALGAGAIVRWVVRPLTGMTEAMRSLAQGDLATAVPSLARHDEIGAMAASVQTFKDAALAKHRLEQDAVARNAATETERAGNEAARATIQRQQHVVVTALANGLGCLANGDLTGRLEDAFEADYEILRRDFNTTAASLEVALRTIARATGAIGSGTAEIAHASDALSRRTEQQAASLEETAAALGLITATVRKMAAGAVEAASVVVAARGAAQNSGAVVTEAVEAMGKIKDTSGKITQIIGVIDEIAFQTNLLALNAGVEAARAGDAGRGFAVVASEVRGLAQRSAEAAKEIKTLISASTTQVESGVVLVGRTGDALREIIDRVSEIDALVHVISQQSQEQATGLAEVNIAVSQMDQVVQQNAAMVEESTAAAHALRQETDGLTTIVRRFRITDEDGGTPNGMRSKRAAGGAG